jgi:MORN repeat variant
VPLRNGRRHGIARTWHKNGVLATEEPYQNDLLHGVCRQWNEAGKLLGKYRMIHGTGLQRAWHTSGKLQLEVSTVRGEFSGRNRIWLRDGSLFSERIYLHGRIVSADAYREAAAKDKSLPKFRKTRETIPHVNGAMQKHLHDVFVTDLLKHRNRNGARKWLHKEIGDHTARSLGHFKREKDAATFVQKLYAAGAVKVIVPDIYNNKTGDQFADGLLVRLPNTSAKRKVIRHVCAELRKHKLGAVQPDMDIGETHLYLSMN